MRNQPPKRRCTSVMFERCGYCNGCVDASLADIREPETEELDTRELLPYDDDTEDTLPDAGAETSHR